MLRTDSEITASKFELSTVGSSELEEQGLLVSYPEANLNICIKILTELKLLNSHANFYKTNPGEKALISGMWPDTDCTTYLRRSQKTSKTVKNSESKNHLRLTLTLK